MLEVVIAGAMSALQPIKKKLIEMQIAIAEALGIPRPP
jgi:hypothetical protein